MFSPSGTVTVLLAPNLSKKIREEVVRARMHSKIERIVRDTNFSVSP